MQGVRAALAELIDGLGVGPGGAGDRGGRAATRPDAVQGDAAK
jgi:hypothetical protein